MKEPDLFHLLPPVFVCLCTILLLAFVPGPWVSTCCAAKYIGSIPGDQGDGVIEFWEDDDGTLWLWWKHNDGRVEGYEMSRGSGEGREVKKPTPDEMRDMIRRAKHGAFGRGVQAHNPITGMRNAHGKGLAPRWNPPEMRNAPGSKSCERPSAQSIKSRARKDNGHKSNTGKNQVPKVPTMPSTGGMGTKSDLHPEKVNPVPFK